MEGWEGQHRGTVWHSCALAAEGAIFPAASQYLLAGKPRPLKGPKCFAALWALSFDGVGASALPGIIIHNKHQAINCSS